MCHDEGKSQTKFCGYIAVYQDDLYIASPTPEDNVNTLKFNYKLNNKADYHLGAEYPNKDLSTQEIH